MGLGQAGPEPVTVKGPSHRGRRGGVAMSAASSSALVRISTRLPALRTVESALVRHAIRDNMSIRVSHVTLAAARTVSVRLFCLDG